MVEIDASAVNGDALMVAAEVGDELVEDFEFDFVRAGRFDFGGGVGLGKVSKMFGELFWTLRKDAKNF